MTSDLRALEELEKIKPIPVWMPDGVLRLATLQGAINLSPKIKLTKVLYVRNFCCNLISISQLNRELRCTVTYNNIICSDTMLNFS